MISLLPGASFAAWDVYPELTAEAGVDDNVSLNANNEDTAGTYTGTGTLYVRNVTETSEIKGGATARRTEYSGTRVRSQTSFGARLDARRRQERINYGFLGDYQREPMLRSAMIDTGTGEILGRAPIDTSVEVDPQETPVSDLDIGFEEQQVKRQRTRLMPWVVMVPTQRSRVRLAAELRTASFGQTAELLGFHDTKTMSAQAQYQYQLSERNAAYINTQFSKIDVDDSVDFDRNDLTVGVRHRFSEYVRLLAEAGVSHAKSDNGNDTTGAIALAQIWADLPRSQLMALIERRNYPTAFGDLLETNRFLAQWRYQLSERWFSESTALYQNTSSNVEKVTATERDYADLELRLGYALTPRVQVGGFYRFRWMDRAIDKQDATSNGAFLFLSYSPPRPF